jgi:hypothetical protein
LQLHHQKPVWKPTPNQRIFLRWRKLLNAPTAGQYMKLGTTKPCPRITVWRTVKSAGNRWTRGTARTFGTTNSSRCQTARMFERGRALTSTIGDRQLSPRSNPHEASTDIRRRLQSHIWYLSPARASGTNFPKSHSPAHVWRGCVHIEIANHAHRLGRRREDGKGHACNTIEHHRVGAQLFVKVHMRPFAEQVEM